MKADFFVCYTNFHFEDFDDKKKSHFAEKFHFDTCFSKNTLKLFIIINNVSTSDGPLQYYSKPDFLFREDICLSSSLEEFTGQEGAAIVGSAATNLHRASIPLVGKKRTQIMIQFNPYKKNAINQNLYKYQFKKEMKKTSLCSSVINKTICGHGNRCNFAHNISELTIMPCKHGACCFNISVSNTGLVYNSQGRFCKYIHPQETITNYISRNYKQI